MGNINGSYFADSGTAASLGTITQTMAQAESDRFDAAVGINQYRWANAAARTAQLGMRTGDKGYQVDTDVTYRYSGSTWVMWEATSTLTVASGYTLASGASVAISGHVVSIMFEITKTAGGAVPAYTTILTVPPGFRPIANAEFGGGGTNPAVADYVCAFTLSAVGTVQLTAFNAGAPTIVRSSASWPI